MAGQVKVPAAVSTATSNGKWDEVRSHLAEDILDEPGSSPEVHGRDNTVKALQGFFTRVAKFTGHKVRQLWEEQGRIKNRKDFVIACTDIYRVENGKVSEWRVRASISPLFIA